MESSSGFDGAEWAEQQALLRRVSRRAGSERGRWWVLWRRTATGFGSLGDTIEDEALGAVFGAEKREIYLKLFFL